MDKRLKTLIGTAIVREEEAYAFYRDILAQVEDPVAKETVEWIADEEKKHKAFLIHFRDSGS